MVNPDADFGEMVFNEIDAWDCRLSYDFAHQKTRKFAVHIWADANGPTELQRDQFKTLKTKYSELWPQIAKNMIACHDKLATIDDVADAMSAHISVHIGEHNETSVELVIDLDLPDEGFRGYFMPIENGTVGNVVVAD